MPYRCYSLEDEKITFVERTPKGELQREFGSPPGILRDAQNLPLSGWCRISPTYRDLPADASPAIRAKAKEVFARLCYRHQHEVHDVEGGRFVFRVEHLVEPNSLRLQDYRWYYGIGVYQRTDPQAKDPFPFATWDYPAGTKLGPNTDLPMGTRPHDLAAIGKSKGIPCVTKATGSALPSGYPSWVIGLGLAAAGGAVYLLTRQKPSAFKRNPQKAHRSRPPKGFRKSPSSGDLACPHRDVSVCPSCAAAHPEIVKVYGQHFWTASEREKRELQELLSKPNPAKRNGTRMPMTPAQRDAILHNKRLTKTTRALYATGAWSMSALAAALQAWSVRKDRDSRMTRREAFDLVGAMLDDA